ncbi:hypothetical protein VNO77_04340 [Canavalia gladiata]|uniref:Uncharacterized protein n=1 Tax=Canavalia gladiata TaxID=3824 RepID=A0AAN9MX01_CANGL
MLREEGIFALSSRGRTRGESCTSQKIFQKKNIAPRLTGTHSLGDPQGLTSVLEEKGNHAPASTPSKGWTVISHKDLLGIWKVLGGFEPLTRGYVEQPCLKARFRAMATSSTRKLFSKLLGSIIRFERSTGSRRVQQCRLRFVTVEAIPEYDRRNLRNLEGFSQNP